MWVSILVWKLFQCIQRLLYYSFSEFVIIKIEVIRKQSFSVQLKLYITRTFKFEVDQQELTYFLRSQLPLKFIFFTQYFLDLFYFIYSFAFFVFLITLLPKSKDLFRYVHIS